VLVDIVAQRHLAVHFTVNLDDMVLDSVDLAWSILIGKGVNV